MNRSRVIFFCLVAFIIPVALSVLLVPDLFFGSKSSDSQPIQNNLQNDGEQSSENSNSSKSFVEVQNDDVIDPTSDVSFLVSVKFTIAALPAEGQSVRLFTKYDEQNWPHSGWALKLKRQTGTIRPEVYWMGPNSRGGWYTFGEVEIKENHWNSLSLVVENGKSISLFYEDLTTEGDATGISLPKFIGGYTVSEIPLPKNVGSLKILIPVSSKISEKLAMHDLIIARFKQLDSPILRLISGGPSELAQRINSKDISLWIDARGKDRSSFARKVARTID